MKTEITVHSLGRIHSIDALRGITLLGIFLVHMTDMFGFISYQNTLSNIGQMISLSISLLLSNRCAPVFSMLFGVSFFLILRKPSYTSMRFLWRCIILIIIGLFNKFFYTYDALMWYGIGGICLLLFRYTSPKILLTSAIGFRLISLLLVHYHLGDVLFPSYTEYNRYSIENDLITIVSYPLLESIKDYLRIVFNGGIFGTFSYFLLGYWFALKAFITNIEMYARMKNVVAFGLIYIFLYVLFFFTRISAFGSLGNVFGALFMAIMFLYIYYKYPSSFKFLESYGKLGLTNYTLQSLFGVVSMSLFIIPSGWDMPAILSYFLLFYLLQCIFSYYWLCYFTNGPLEWLWRCVTNRKFTSPLKSTTF